MGARTAAMVMLATGFVGGGALGSTTAEASSSPFRILILTALTTTYVKTNAQTEVLLAKAGVTVINRQGGVNSHKVVLTVQNDGGSPTTMVTKIEAALRSPNKPDVIIPADAGTESEAALPILNQAKMFTFNQTPTTTSGNPTDFPYSFDMAPSVTGTSKAFVAYAKAHGAKTVGVFHNNDSYGISNSAALVKQAKAGGLTVTATVQYNETALTFTATLEKLEATNPQERWATAYGAPSGYMLRDLDKIGWTVPVIADDSFSVPPPITTVPPVGSLGTALQKNLKFETFTAGVYKPPSRQSKNVTTKLNAMHRQGEPKASLLFGYEYDAVLMSAYAARAAHTLNAAAKMAKEIVAQQKSHAVPTAIFASYNDSSKSHSPNPPTSSFSFIKPTKLITGQFGAPGSTAG